MRLFTILAALSLILTACSASPEEADTPPTESSTQALEGDETEGEGEEAEADEAETTEAETTEAETTEAETTEAAPEPKASAETAPEDIKLNDGTRQVGDITKCPVSGEVFTVAEDSPSVEHDGGTYYLCCGGCVDKFKADPAKFAAAGKAGESVGKPKKMHKGDGHHHGEGHHGGHNR